jgi:RNA recognition motif-containing protein
MESGDGGGTPGQESTPVEAAEAESQQAPSHCPPESTLWMGALKAEWTPDFIREAFRLMGVEIVGVKLTTDRGDPSKPGTYCFVEFADSDTARLAMVAAAGHTIRNDPEKGKFHLSFANSPQHTTEYNLFISNLDRSVDDVDLFRVSLREISNDPGH